MNDELVCNSISVTHPRSRGQMLFFLRRMDNHIGSLELMPSEIALAGAQRVFFDHIKEPLRRAGLVSRSPFK